MVPGTIEQAKAQQVMKSVFYPDSVAVIGASSDSERERNSGWVGRLVQFGYKGKIYPIIPRRKRFLVCPSILPSRKSLRL